MRRRTQPRMWSRMEFRHSNNKYQISADVDIEKWWNLQIS